VRMPRNGSRWLVALIGVVTLFAAGCGGDAVTTQDSEQAAAAREVEDALYGLGTTQLIDCVALGTLPVAGVDREVVRCSFEEEESGDGSMRQRSGCFVAEAGRALDVTRDVPDAVDCVVPTSP
jgi:hypothetical protein